MKRSNLFRGLGLCCLVFLCTIAFNQVGQAADEVVTLKFANYYPQPAPQSKICEEFIAELESRTQGRVKVNYFPGGALLKGPAMLNGIESGIADIGLAHIQYTAGRMAVSEVNDLPLGFPSVYVSSQVVNDFYYKFRPQEWEKVQPLWLFTNSPSVLVTTKPVRSLEDLKGMTIRAPGPIGEVIQALGGTPAPTPIVETYDAISKGVVDGAFVSPEAVKTFRFAEVAKYITMSWNVGSSYTFYVIMNKQKYDSLPADVKQVIDKLSGEFKERFPIAWNAVDFGGIGFAKEKNVEFIELSQEELDRWMTKAEPVIDGYVKRMVDKGFKESEVKEWLAFSKERSKYWSAKQVALGLKTATGTAEMTK